MIIYTYLDYVQIEKINKNILKETNEEYRHQRNKIHDKVYRDLLGDKEDTIKLLNKYLNPKKKLKEEDIEKYDTSYITENYESKEADIVYKLKDKNIFFSIEHQSRIDNGMSYRILNYSMEIIRSVVGRNPKIDVKHKLPKVIPIVLYTGIKKWNAKNNIEEIQEKCEEHKGTGVMTGYNVIDVSDKEELLEDDIFISKAMILDKVENGNETIEYMEKILGKLKNEKDINKFVKIIRYSAKEEEREEVEKIILKIKEKGGTEMLRFAKVLRKEGRQEGIQEGKRVGIIGLIKNMLEQGLNEELILKYTGIKKEELEDYKKQMV